MRAWSKLPIVECGENMEEIPVSIKRIDPHPYSALGAPYGKNEDPFKLREGVLDRLLNAQKILHKKDPDFNLCIFDAWRPLEVQEFMFNHALHEECLLVGINPFASTKNDEFQKIIHKVSKFWAPPSKNLATPPPHSTGAAVDLCLINSSGTLLDMGSQIDAIGDISNPDYFYFYSIDQPESEFSLFHQRRLLLADSMIEAGFVQHPNEWWHFSYGDQLWAWTSNLPEAFYGRI